MLYHRPEVVMPLVFGGVQLGNTVFTCLDLKKWPKRGFVAGVLLLIVGVVVALSFRPGSQHGEEALNWWFLRTSPMPSTASPRLGQGRVDRRKTDKELQMPWDELKRADRADAERPARSRHAF
jgi:hypothetical protein